MAVQELFRANKRESTVDIVVNNIKKLLIERKLKPGDRLPNEVEISEAMNVSRGSVREALRILTAFGLVESRVGTGTYICQKPGRTLADSLLFSFFVNNPNIGKLYEFRRLIEIDILESVLDHYDENEEERRMLEENVDELKELLTKNPDTDWLRENDISFHCLMGICTKNVLMERIYGIEHGGDHGNQYQEAKPNNSVLAKSQSDLAAEMGFTVQTLQNYKALTEMIPELEDLVDTGIVTNTTALSLIRPILINHFSLKK